MNTSQYQKISPLELAIPTQTLPLRCQACKELADYDVGKVIIHPELLKSISAKLGARVSELDEHIRWEEYVYFTGYFICRNCGWGGPWKFPRDTKAKLFALLMAHGNSPTIFIGKPILFDGTVSRSGYYAAAHLRKLIDADPKNAYLWNRLGNVFSSAEQFELALPPLEKAIELNPSDVESLHSIAECWHFKGDWEKAAHYFHDVLRHARKGTWHNVALKENLVRHTLERLYELHEQTKGKIDLFPKYDPAPSQPESAPVGGGSPDQAVVVLSQFDLSRESDWQRLVQLFLDDPETWRAKSNGAHSPAPMRGPKMRQLRSATGHVGRNDPCPCGSGKKFKLCCQKKASIR